MNEPVVYSVRTDDKKNTMPSDEKLCIICGVRKPKSLFERKGEHIVPKFLGSRRLRTPHVCRECNGGFGGTVDLALKRVFTVSLACIDRGVVGARKSSFSERNADYDSILWGNYDSAGNQHHREINPPDNRLRKNPDADINIMKAWPPNGAPKLDNSLRDDPDVKGAVLKIAYEAAHLRLGDSWLHDSTAVAIRNVLSAYVSKDREKAHRLMNDIDVYNIPINLFYFTIGKSRSEYVKNAIKCKSCLNGLWLAPVKTQSGRSPLAVVFDIEGLPPGYVVVSESSEGIGAPELLSPRISG